MDGIRKIAARARNAGVRLSASALSTIVTDVFPDSPDPARGVREISLDGPGGQDVHSVTNSPELVIPETWGAK